MTTREDRATAQLEQQLKARHYTRPIINRYTLTLHAVARMVIRKIEREWVEDTLKSPGRGSVNGTRKHVGPMAMCVVNHTTKEIVTIGYGTLNEPAQHHAPRRKRPRRMDDRTRIRLQRPTS